MKKLLTGRKFGRLLAKEPLGQTASGKTVYRCLCQCGVEVLVAAGSLSSGNTASCGCLKRERDRVFADEKRKSGYIVHHLRAYNSWRHMLDRCNNPLNPHFDAYGGRGITVCAKWRDFRNFVSELGDPPPGRTLDRIDSSGNYESTNCRWATPKQQARNTRRNVFVEFNGERMTVAEVAERSGVSPSTLYGRRARGADLFPQSRRRS